MRAHGPVACGVGCEMRDWCLLSLSVGLASDLQALGWQGRGRRAAESTLPVSPGRVGVLFRARARRRHWARVSLSPRRGLGRQNLF